MFQSSIPDIAHLRGVLVYFKFHYVLSLVSLANNLDLIISKLHHFESLRLSPIGYEHFMSILSSCAFARSDSLWILFLIFILLLLCLLGSTLYTSYESDILYNMPVITRSQS